MSGWTDPDVIAQMLELAHATPVSDSDKQRSVAMGTADVLERSSNLTLKTVGRVGRALTSVTLDISAAGERGDFAGAMELLQGLIIAMTASYASLLVQPDPAQTTIVKRLFDDALAVSVADRKARLESGKS